MSFFILFLKFYLLELVFLSVSFLLLSYLQVWYNLGFTDILSNFMMLISLFFFLIFEVMSSKYTKKAMSNYKQLVFLLNFMVVICFWFKSVWGFYIFFEFSLIPLLFVIYWFGYQVERLQASFYLFFYTMFGSLPLLFGIFYLAGLMNISSLGLFETAELNFSKITSVFVSFVFFIKLPVFLFHLWLPKAHVEAPVMGSMILAAILLKLGGYGLFRFFFLVKCFFGGFLFILSVWGAFISSIICFIQSDLKSLVAYSSISHMGVMMAGFFLTTGFSMKGFFVILISHAFCSSALFYFVNLIYERSLSRQVLLVRAMKGGLYFLLFYLFIYLAANFSAPPTFNLVGELVFFVSFFSYSFLTVLLLGLISFFVAFYCLYAYSNIAQGLYWKFKSVFFVSDYDWMIMTFHVLPIFLLLFFLREM